MNLDLNKMPLGTLSKTQLDAGYEILRNIQQVRGGGACADAADWLIG